MTSYRLGGTLLAAATLLATVLTGTATATEPATATESTTVSETAHGWSRLILNVKARHGHQDRTVRLDCQPAGGSHPHPRRACLEMAYANGDFNDLAGTPDMIACTMEYRPVVAEAHGRWHGHRVLWQHQYPNPCTLLYETGVVFDF